MCSWRSAYFYLIQNQHVSTHVPASPCSTDSDARFGLQAEDRDASLPMAQPTIFYKVIIIARTK